MTSLQYQVGSPARDGQRSVVASLLRMTATMSSPRATSAAFLFVFNAVSPARDSFLARRHQPLETDTNGKRNGHKRGLQKLCMQSRLCPSFSSRLCPYTKMLNLSEALWRLLTRTHGWFHSLGGQRSLGRYAPQDDSSGPVAPLDDRHLWIHHRQPGRLSFRVQRREPRALQAHSNDASHPTDCARARVTPST